ncbi:MAG: redoxin domain-containing protein [Bacteroidota bacterium]
MKRYFILPSFIFLMLVSYSLNAQIVMPAFAFSDLEGKTFTNADLDMDKPIFVMMFDPYCEHCEAQASNIAEQAEKFEHVQFVFVTLEPEVSAITTFRDKHFGDTNIDQLYFLMDTDVAFESYFGYTDDSVNIYLYHPDRKKPKYFGEEQTAEVLLKYL